MDDFRKKYGQWALVAGAAEGLGEAYCRALARRKMNLLMVDFQGDKNTALARELEGSFGIDTIRLDLDLADRDAPEQIMKAMNDLDCRLIVYNAAYSRVKPFLANTTDDLDRYIEINARTPIHMVHSFAARLKTSGGGGILIMSSLAALWGTQLLGPYGATKAFGYVLAEALAHELKPYGIDVMACMAGATATPAYLGTHPKYGWPRPSVMKPGIVAEKAIRKLGKKVFYVPGFSNQLNYFLPTRVFSRKFSRLMFNSTTGKMYRKRF